MLGVTVWTCPSCYFGEASPLFGNYEITKNQLIPSRDGLVYYGNVFTTIAQRLSHHPLGDRGDQDKMNVARLQEALDNLNTSGLTCRSCSLDKD